ncbi:MAG: hypothetical protein JWP09_605 [Candidatus Taylorbacteria bacterium]|nr:hypothetical protein [Candidatus Taylorbacteria bacterium]
MSELVAPSSRLRIESCGVTSAHHAVSNRVDWRRLATDLLLVVEVAKSVETIVSRVHRHAVIAGIVATIGACVHWDAGSVIAGIVATIGACDHRTTLAVAVVAVDGAVAETSGNEDSEDEADDERCFHELELGGVVGVTQAVCFCERENEPHKWTIFTLAFLILSLFCLTNSFQRTLLN